VSADAGSWCGSGPAEHGRQATQRRSKRARGAGERLMATLWRSGQVGVGEQVRRARVALESADGVGAGRRTRWVWVKANGCSSGSAGVALARERHNAGAKVEPGARPRWSEWRKRVMVRQTWS
jgi:hypothetical protein